MQNLFCIIMSASFKCGSKVHLPLVSKWTSDTWVVVASYFSVDVL